MVFSLFVPIFEIFSGRPGNMGAIVIPGVVMGMLFLMPFIGKSKGGHRLNVGLICLADFPGPRRSIPDVRLTRYAPGITAESNQPHIQRWPPFDFPMNGIKKSIPITTPGITIAPIFPGRPENISKIGTKEKYHSGRAAEIGLGRVCGWTHSAPSVPVGEAIRCRTIKYSSVAITARQTTAFRNAWSGQNGASSRAGDRSPANPCRRNK